MVKARAMALKAIVSSRHSQECEGLGAPGGGFAANLVPQPDGEALGARHGGDGGEVARRQGHRWHGTVRQAPEKWMAKEWWKVYDFAKEGKGMASRTDQFIDGKVLSPSESKGWICRSRL